MPLRPMVNRFGGCFCLGSGPVFWVVFWFLLFCFAFSAGETQVWLGDLRVVVFCLVVVFGFVASIDLLTPRTFLSLYSVFSAYSHVRTEPLARHRPHSRKKKNLTEEGLSEILSTARGVRTFVGLGLCLSKRRLDGWLSCRYCRTNKRRTYCFRCGSTS